MDGDSALAIETTALVKRFKRQIAVDHVELRVPRGAVFGFLGPNGSGKTSTIRMLLGLSAPTAGEVRLLGQSMPASSAKVLSRVGALVEGPGFYPYLSGRSNLLRLDTADPHSPPASRRKRVDEALERVGLSAAADKKAKAYSLGMKQRLGLAAALVTSRDLLVLDEPTNGLDPQGTREVRHLIRSFADSGATVFVSSHLLAEIEQMCTHVGVMSEGRLVAQGTLDELRHAGRAVVMVETPDPARASEVLTRLGLAVDDARADGHSARTTAAVADSSTVVSGAVLSTSPDRLPEDVLRALVEAGVRVRAFRVQETTLEDRFVELTGEGFDVAH